MMRWMHAHIGKLWMGLVYGFLFAPLVFLVVFSFNSTRQDSRFTGFSLRWYEALANDSRLLEGFLVSLKVAFVSATLSVVLATLAAYTLVRYTKLILKSKEIFQKTPTRRQDRRHLFP